MREMKANLIGLLALAILVAVTSLLVPSLDVAKPMWLFAYVLWVVCALFVWHHRLAPVKPGKWLLAAIGSVVAAILWFGSARLVARLALGDGGSGLSRFFDLGVALMIAPGVAFIALAGWVRCMFLAPKS